jgi:hypothetical protein
MSEPLQVTIPELLQMLGTKQVQLELANARIAAMERVAREHMAKEHPEPAPEEPAEPAPEA